MKITICSSMVFTERAFEAKKELEKLGHKVFLSGFANEYLGKTEKEKRQESIPIEFSYFSHYRILV